MLYKVVTQGEITAGEIARELVLDPGYLSRILRKFEDDGLVKRKVSTGDARQAILTVTRRRKGSFADLNERSNRQARSLLEGVSASKIAELAHRHANR